MDTMKAYRRAEAAKARGAKMMVFDWERAAKRIRETNTKVASAGLAEDWEWTGGVIWEGCPVPAEDTYVYLASIHAEPQLDLDGNIESCWKYQDETPGWDSGTYWPQEALDILKEKE